MRIINRNPILCKIQPWQFTPFLLTNCYISNTFKLYQNDSYKTTHSNAFSRMDMMRSSCGNSFCVTGPLCGEFTGHRYIPFTKASEVQRWCFVDLHQTHGSVNNRNAGDLRRHHAQYDVTLLKYVISEHSFSEIYIQRAEWCSVNIGSGYAVRQQDISWPMSTKIHDVIRPHQTTVFLLFKGITNKPQ